MMNHETYIKAYKLNSKPWVEIVMMYLEKNDSATVSDIEELLGIAHSDASQRLKRLRAIGYVKASKQGQGHYKVQRPTGKTFKDVMKEYAEYLLKITFECGPTVFSITSGGLGFAEAKKATIAKLQSMKEHYEKKFDEL